MSANIRHSSNSVEHYTPSYIIEPARALLGGIELDPASTTWSNNRLVQANRIFTKKGNGFNQEWAARSVFLNPPGGMCDLDGRCLSRIEGKTGWYTERGKRSEHAVSSSKSWWFKLVDEWAKGRAKSALFVGFSVEILQSTQTRRQEWQEGLSLPLDFPYCVPAQRIPFLNRVGNELIPGTQPSHSNVLVYLPPDLKDKKFKKVFFSLFASIGHCVWPMLD